MSEIEKPWVPAELPKSAKKTSLVDDIADQFSVLWAKDENDFVALATSTGREDAVEGSVTIDKILLARLIKQAAGENTRLGQAKVGDIARVVHHAAKRFGVDRKSIAAKKAEFLALQQGEQTKPEEPAA